MKNQEGPAAHSTPHFLPHHCVAALAVHHPLHCFWCGRHLQPATWEDIQQHSVVLAARCQLVAPHWGP